MAKIGLIGIAAVFLSMLFKKEKPEFEDLKSIVQQHNYTISLDDVKKQYWNKENGEH